MPQSCPFAVESIISVLNAKGHQAFENSSGHDLNLVGIRTDDQTANSFNDWLTVFYDYAGRWNFFAFSCTTDPGLFYRENPANVRGTAIVVPGQYRGLWKRGKHRGRYKALVQAKPISVWRDADRDARLEPGPVDEGFFGINLHRSGAARASTQVDKWSAGCQVLQDPDQFAFLMRLCDKQVETHGWESFTYTLLEEKDFR
jgi:hypothetical protein